MSLLEKNILSNRKVIINNNISKIIHHHKIDTSYEKEYYKVDINNIKFMMYDFNQEVVININKKEKKSQVEIVIENYNSMKNINISEDINYSNFSFRKFLKNSKNKYEKNEKKKINTNKENYEKENYENKNIIDKEKEFEKEITNALSKQDEQKPIIQFYNVTILFVFLIFSMGIFEIYFIINKYSKLKENIKLILLATNLKYFTNFGIFYIRENSLYTIDNNITNGKYNIPDLNP